MIIYGTKQTIERYNIKMAEQYQNPFAKSAAIRVLEKEKDDPLLEWGAKLFYFDRRKCIQLCNFASKYTIVLVDFKIADLKNIGDLIARYMLDAYSGNNKMQRLLERYFMEASLMAFARLTDRKIISSLNRMQSVYLEDGNRLYDYIENGVLLSRNLNKDINRYCVTMKIKGKKEYFLPVDRFAELLKDRYK